MHAALAGSSVVHIWDAQTHLYIEGWTSSSLVGDSYRTGALGGWGVCKLSVPQTVAHKSGLPPGARTAQASPLSRDKESLPPAWGLPERDSSSPRIGQLSWGGPRRTGGKRLGRSFGSLSSGCFLLAHRGRWCSPTWPKQWKTKGWTGRTAVATKLRIPISFLSRRTNNEARRLSGMLYVVLEHLVKKIYIYIL